MTMTVSRRKDSHRIEMGRDYLDDNQASIVDKDQEEDICTEDEEDKLR